MAIESMTAREILGLERSSDFNEACITIASPEIVESWSKGEIKNPETINYRTFKPEKGGLFCERIFGPTKDWECACGKYKRIKYKGVVCDRCGVEVTLSRVRRQRMGHIRLAVPVAHIWFLKCMPSRLGLMMDMTARDLERVIYYEDYLVIDPGQTQLRPKQLLTEQEHRDAVAQYGEGSFIAKMGAEAVRDCLRLLDLEEIMAQLTQSMDQTRSKQLRKKMAKRLKLVQGFLGVGTRPEWMILEILPVIPPDLRPLVPLEGGRFATSDLNDLYRRVINRNNRLRTLLQLKTPEVIIRNEKRMLQEAVDALLDNGRHGRAVTGVGNRPLKSLSDMLRGKTGRFRMNLLGKRVDYSGRSVIVVGPELKLNQCGLPKKMALVLFEPFMIRRLRELGHVHTVRSAKKMIEKQDPLVWDILDQVTQGHPVLLNRAPTLHRLSVQAFEPVLIEGDAIRIHPLVCTAYNADFDGDQMAVHVPLSIEAQMEARLLMLASQNIFSPSSGRPIMTPTQDITLGCYYLTQAPHRLPPGAPQRRRPIFSDADEVLFALGEGVIKTHDLIVFANPDFGRDTLFGDKEKKFIETTPGRVIFRQIWPKDMGFFNKCAGKKQLGELILRCYQLVGREETAICLDRLKQAGFQEATRAGISIGMSDMIIPEEKPRVVAKAQDRVTVVERQYRSGAITDGERYNKIVDIWTQATDEISGLIFRTLENSRERSEFNPLFLMVDSGARGNRQQVRQLSGIRGLMAKPSGEIIERPITSNFREGLSVLEYFISTHGARKGLADTALKTADAGYMTRKLHDVAQDVVITEEDCGTTNGLVAQAIYEGDEEIVKLSDRIYGRISCEDITDPVTRNKLVANGDIFDDAKARAVEQLGVEKVRIRSVLTCESKWGVCAKCYGLNLATNRMAKLGEAVGVIAAQSIGEPGTQLTMRTFHIGGTASQIFKQPQIRAKNDGVVQYVDLRVVRSLDGNFVVLNKSGFLSVVDSSGRELERHTIVMGSLVSVADGGEVKKGQVFVQWDPYNVPVLTEKGGVIEFHDIIEGVTVKKELDEATKQIGTVVIEHKHDLHPQIVIRDAKSGEALSFYGIPAGARIEVKPKEEVAAGQRIARTPRKLVKTKDITGGLPRVAELFEARRPKDSAEIARIDGIVEDGGIVRGKRRLLIQDPQSGQEEEHLIPLSKHLIVFKGDVVRKGQQITEGPIVPQEILEVGGVQELQEYLLNEVQEVYRLQGVDINDKHVEIIIRQMLRKVKILDAGDSPFLWGEQVDRLEFDRENREVEAKGGKPAEGVPVLLGIAKASVETESFIAAASFQDTTRVLTEAATLGKIDKLRGFKENIIMGHLIPAGTGFRTYRHLRLVEHGEPPVQPALPEEEASTEKPQWSQLLQKASAAGSKGT